MPLAACRAANGPSPRAARGGGERPLRRRHSSSHVFRYERDLLATLLSRLRALPGDSKWKSCTELLRELDRAEPGVKVLLFTQYRATLAMLEGSVRTLFPSDTTEVIHGDTAMQDRRSARIRFETISRFLLSTEAGGEAVPALVNLNSESEAAPPALCDSMLTNNNESDSGGSGCGNPTTVTRSSFEPLFRNSILISVSFCTILEH